MMSEEQKVFNRVARHLLRQGRRSVLDSAVNGCAYQGKGGLKCAVGCLIKDEFYSPSIETKRVYSSYVVGALRRSGVERKVCNSPLLEDLQILHDNVKPYRWPGALRVLARRYKLDVSKVVGL